MIYYDDVDNFIEMWYNITVLGCWCFTIPHLFKSFIVPAMRGFFLDFVLKIVYNKSVSIGQMGKE